MVYRHFGLRGWLHIAKILRAIRGDTDCDNRCGNTYMYRVIVALAMGKGEVHGEESTKSEGW